MHFLSSKYLFIIVLLFKIHFVFASDISISKVDSILLGIKGNLQFTHGNKNYKNNLQILNSNWNVINNNLVSKVSHWSNNENFPFYKDSSTVYYPFGGPDFLFAQAIYPFAKKYILVGLENIGSIQNIKVNNATHFSSYLSKLSHSLRYVYKAGYFVTKQMMKDLEQDNLDGTLHLFLFYLAKLDYKIIDIDYVKFNSEHKLVKSSEIKPHILRIKFKDTQQNIKELIYIKQNLSNYGLTHSPKYHSYLKKQKPFHTYMKSASYILFNTKFSVERNFILSNAKDILQDDSGIQYKYLNKYFNVLLYGDYTQTTKTFKWAFQKDLSLDLATKKAGNLNFKIGYNRWLNETVLLYATKDKAYYKSKIKPKKEVASYANKPYLQFGVQIAALSSKKNKKKYSVLDYELQIIEENGLYKYIIGFFDNYNECEKIKKDIMKQKYPNAFLVVYKDGHKISPDEWYKIKLKYYN